MSQQQNKSPIEQSKINWRFKKKNNRNIALYSTDALYKQIGYVIDKLNKYIEFEHKLKINYFFLHADYAKLMSDSVMINIFNIVEILDLNFNYINKNYLFNYLYDLKNQPLLVWYIIGTYMKHSYKDYIPSNFEYTKANWRDKYNKIFDAYADYIVNGTRKVKPKNGEMSKEMHEQRKKEFKETYLHWHDFLYVRFFEWKENISRIVSLACNDEKMTPDEEKIALSYNKRKREKTKQALEFFKFLYSYKSQDKDKPIYETWIYQNSMKLWVSFENKNKH